MAFEHGHPVFQSSRWLKQLPAIQHWARLLCLHSLGRHMGNPKLHAECRSNEGPVEPADSMAAFREMLGSRISKGRELTIRDNIVFHLRLTLTLDGLVSELFRP